MLGCVSLENFGLEYSENQIEGGTLLTGGDTKIFYHFADHGTLSKGPWGGRYQGRGTLTIFDFLPLRGTLFWGGHYSAARSSFITMSPPQLNASRRVRKNLFLHFYFIYISVINLFFQGEKGSKIIMNLFLHAVFLSKLQ